MRQSDLFISPETSTECQPTDWPQDTAQAKAHLGYSTAAKGRHENPGSCHVRLVVLDIKANDSACRGDNGRHASQRGVDPAPTEGRHTGAPSPTVPGWRRCSTLLSCIRVNINRGGASDRDDKVPTVTPTGSEAGPVVTMQTAVGRCEKARLKSSGCTCVLSLVTMTREGAEGHRGTGRGAGPLRPAPG